MRLDLKTTKNILTIDAVSTNVDTLLKNKNTVRLTFKIKRKSLNYKKNFLMKLKQIRWP